jgi:epoxide hydrolase-like predicted phosphatase
MFDFGGVITTSPFDAFGRYERDHGLPEGLLRQINSTDPDHNAWAQLERGEIDFPSFCALFEEEARVVGFEVDASAVVGVLGGEIRPQMVEAVRHCSSRFKTACLTNNFLSMEAGLRPDIAEVFALFNVVFESSRLGVRKPDPEFYRLACEALAVAPNEVVFLDDLGVNLKPARAMGMETILVRSPDTALRELFALVGDQACRHRGEVVGEDVDVSTIEGQPGVAGTTDGSRSARSWSEDARYFEYSAAADPIGSGYIPRVPIVGFPRSLHEGGPTRVVPLDLSTELGIASGPATSPGLLANFVRIAAGDHVTTHPNATSQLFYVIEGRGRTSVDGTGDAIEWMEGDFVTLPSSGEGPLGATHRAVDEAVLYWVHDEPMLRYLGVRATEPRFRATRYPRADAMAELEAIAAAPDANDKSRVSVLLANASQEQTLTITHVLWAMFGLLPTGQVQRPHRHQSVALDLILDCEPGCHTLLGSHLDDRGDIIDPVRVPWEAGGAFVTPPGMWHAHVNESGSPAHLIPIQDAGMQTYLRSLDIRFTNPA